MRRLSSGQRNRSESTALFFAFTRLEQIAFGVPLGVTASSLALLAMACLLSFSGGLVWSVAIAGAVAAIFLWRGQSPLIDRRTGERTSGRIRKGKRPKNNAIPEQTVAASGDWTHSRIFAVIVFGLFVLRWALFWSGALRYDDKGLWSSDIGTWADWSLHIGDVSSFVFGNNFPPHDPHYAGVAYAYHYLVSVTAAAMVKAGMTVTGAMSLQSFLFSLLVAASIYCFAKRLTDDRAAAALTIVLVLLGGGWGWLLTLSGMDWSHPLSSLLQHPWDPAVQEKANFRWLNTYFALIEPQRAFLYGVPLALLIVTALFAAVRTGKLRFFLAAGVIAGLLPFANLSALLALALVTPFLFLLFPAWRWMYFFGVWIAVAVPQLYLQQGGGAGAASAIRMQLGWVASPDNWFLFWAKNLGLFIPLLIVAVCWKDLIEPAARRFLLAFMPAFIIANVVVFQPWDWDNTKVFLFWFVAASVLVSAAVTRLWNTFNSMAPRVVIIAATLTMILSGLLINLNQLLGREHFLLLSSDELRLAEQVRQSTPPRALFAVGLQNNHPVPVLGGRSVLMSYPGWLWSHGYDYAERERDLRELYLLSPRTPAIISKYGIDYLVIGPWERNEFHSDEDRLRQTYPRVIATNDYEVFRLR